MRYTPTQHRLMAVLSDGRPHRPAELLASLGDGLATLQNLRDHISRLRKRVAAAGLEVVCVIHNRTVHYRLMPSPHPRPPAPN